VCLVAAEVVPLAHFQHYIQFQSLYFSSSPLFLLVFLSTAEKVLTLFSSGGGGTELVFNFIISIF